MREDLKRLGLAARQDPVRHRCLTSVVRSDSLLGEVQLMMQRARWFRSSVNLVPAPQRRVGSVAASRWSDALPETGPLWPERASRCMRFMRSCRGSKSSAVIGERNPLVWSMTRSDQQHSVAGWASRPASDVAAATSGSAEITLCRQVPTKPVRALVQLARTPRVKGERLPAPPISSALPLGSMPGKCSTAGRHRTLR